MNKRAYYTGLLKSAAYKLEELDREIALQKQAGLGNMWQAILKQLGSAKTGLGKLPGNVKQYIAKLFGKGGKAAQALSVVEKAPKVSRATIRGLKKIPLSVSEKINPELVISLTKGLPKRKAIEVLGQLGADVPLNKANLDKVLSVGGSKKKLLDRLMELMKSHPGTTGAIAGATGGLGSGAALARLLGGDED